MSLKAGERGRLVDTEEPEAAWTNVAVAVRRHGYVRVPYIKPRRECKVRFVIFCGSHTNSDIRWRWNLRVRSEWGIVPLRAAGSDL